MADALLDHGALWSSKNWIFPTVVGGTMLDMAGGAPGEARDGSTRGGRVATPGTTGRRAGRHRVPRGSRRPAAGPRTVHTLSIVRPGAPLNLTGRRIRRPAPATDRKPPNPPKSG